MLLAHGMRYELPDLAGVSEMWAKRVFHCPYCHGWEVRDQHVAVYGCSERAVHQALLLSSLTDDVVLLCDTQAPSRRISASTCRAPASNRRRPVERIDELDGAL